MKNARNLKGTGIYLNEDYCSETTKLRKSLWDQVKILLEQGKSLETLGTNIYMPSLYIQTKIY